MLIEYGLMERNALALTAFLLAFSLVAGIVCGVI